MGITTIRHLECTLGYHEVLECTWEPGNRSDKLAVTVKKGAKKGHVQIHIIDMLHFPSESGMIK